jgi:hypothetical protein
MKSANFCDPLPVFHAADNGMVRVESTQVTHKNVDKQQKAELVELRKKCHTETRS